MGCGPPWAAIVAPVKLVYVTCLLHLAGRTRPLGNSLIRSASPYTQATSLAAGSLSPASRGRTRAPGLAREGPGSGGIIATFQSWRLLLAGFSRPCWLGSGASPSAHEELSLIWCLEEQVVAPIAPSTDLPLPHHPNLLSCFIPPRSHGPQTVHLPEVPTQREKWT